MLGSRARTMRLGPRSWILIGAAAIAVVELVLRSQGFGREVWTEPSARYGWRMLPHVEYVDRPMTTVVRTNAAGFRDREWPDPTPDPGELRIAFVGNSVTFGGGGIEVEERFDRVVDELVGAELASRGDRRRARTLNFALPGYTLEQMTRAWEDLIRPHRPDVLVVALFAYDVRPMRPMWDPPRYPFRLQVERSGLYDVYKRYLAGGWGSIRDAEQIAVEASIEVDPYAPEHDELWRAADARMRTLIEQAREIDCRVAIVSMAPMIAVLDPDRRWEGPRVAEWCARHGALHVDPLQRVRDAMRPLRDEMHARKIAFEQVFGATRDDQVGKSLETRGASPFLFSDPDHYSGFGHRVLGEVVFEALRERGWLAP